MSGCRKDLVDVILSGVNLEVCSLDAVPLARPNLKLDLIFYRITKFVLKTRLNPKLLYAFSGALLQCIRIFGEYFENLSLLSEAFLPFDDHSSNRRMGFFLL